MTRRLLTLGSVLSLLLCLAALGMWVRSYFVEDSLNFGFKGGRRHRLMMASGRVAEVASPDDHDYEGGIFWDTKSAAPSGILPLDYPTGAMQQIGFGYSRYQYIGFSRNAPLLTYRVICLPL